MKRTAMTRVAVVIVAILIAFSSCQQFSLFDELGGSVKGAETTLLIAPTQIEMVAGGSLTFTASGGIQPYVFAVSLGLGTIDASTGVYVAPGSPGNEIIVVTDAVGQTAQANVTVVTAGGPVFISPSNVSVFLGNPFTFVAGGGTPPYSFALTGIGSGSPSIHPTTGAYIAGSSTGSDQVTVTDSTVPIPLTAIANVNVTAVATNVNYHIDEGSGTYGMPAAVTAGGAVSAVDFTITNIGSVDGSYPVSWMLYLSEDGTLGAGDYLVDQGTIAALPSSTESAEINPGGNWPFVEGSYTIFLRVSAPDDLSAGDDITSGDPVTVNPRDVDYSPVVTSFPAQANAGGNASGMIDFDILNIGNDNGLTSVRWTAWMSIGDIDTVDIGDVIIGAGSVSGIAGLGSTSVTVTNALWPTTPDPNWWVVIEVDADDEPAAALANNAAFDGLIDVRAVDVDYDITNVNDPPIGERVAGRSFTSDFDIENVGSDNGTADVHWVAYFSSDPALDEVVDIPFDSGVLSGGLASFGSANNTYSGTWPTGAGSYFILFKLVCGEDNNATNDLESSSSINTSEADVDYSPVLLAFPPVANAGGNASGAIDFEIHNTGADDGGATVHWTVWMSIGDNDIVDAGDVIIGSGAVPGILGGDFVPVTVQNALWPGTPDVDWRIIIQVQADDEPVPATANNLTADGPIALQVADIDYEITTISNPILVERLAGRSFNGTFDVQNIGGDDGTADIQWIAFISTNPTLEEGVDISFDSGVVAGGLNSLQMANVSFNGTWPSASGIYHILIKVVNGEDNNTANDILEGGMVNVTDPFVDYIVTSVNAPASATAGGDASGQIDFTIQNAGTDDGLDGVRWTVWMSMADTDIVDGNDVMIGSGTTGPLSGGGSVFIGPISNVQWPAVSAADWNVIVFAESDDELVSGDFSSDGPVDISYADIDYDVISITNPPVSEQFSGRPFTGGFTAQNIGLDNGSSDVHWVAYISSDPTLDEGTDLAFFSDVIPGGLNSFASASPGFSGTWPATPGPHYIIVKLVSAEESNTGNDTETGTLINTTPANVDYAAVGLTMSTPVATNSVFAETFTLDNIGDDGAELVFWEAYASLGDTVIDGSDILIDSDVEFPMTEIEAPRVVPIDGYWPGTAGSPWYILLRVSAPDDVNNGNDIISAGPVTIADAQVDYRVDALNPPIDLLAGRSFGDTFTIKNEGSDAGTTNVSWYLYYSTDAVLDEGIDTVFASGIQGPIGAGGSVGGIGYAGTWPTTPGSYFIISKLDVAEDIDQSDNEQAWGPYAIDTPDVDYQVVSVSNLGSTVAGDPINAEFEFRNDGPDDGVLPVDWVAVISPDAFYDAATDIVIDEGTELALAGFANNANIPITGTWPEATATWWIIVAVQAADEAIVSTDWATSVNITTSQRIVDYMPDPGSINVTGGISHSAGPFTGEFTYTNNGPDDGTEFVAWEVYASLDTTLDGGDILVAADVGLPAMPAFTTSAVIPFNGTWPLHYGDYRLLVRVTAADDVVSGNDIQWAGPIYNVGNFYDEQLAEINDDFANLINIYVPGIRFEPGMSVLISGQLDNATPTEDDVIEFDTGSASSLTFAMIWGPGHNIDIFVLDGPGSFIDGIGIAGANSLSLTWVVDAPDALRYLDIENTGGGSLAAYTLIITAN